MKQRVKVSITCPRCGSKNIKETAVYHEPIHGDYFKVDDVLNFEELKVKIDNGSYPKHFIYDIYYYLIPFACSGCGENIKILNDTYEVKPAGKYINRTFIKKFFNYLSTKDRFVKDGENECEKEVFVERIWNRFKQNIKDKYLIFRYKEKLFMVAHIVYVKYYLGYGDEIEILALTPLGAVERFILSHNDLLSLEYLEMSPQVCEDLMAYTKIL